MSGADLFEDGYPHGTVQGYDDGCRGGSCPGRLDFGMSCKNAWQAAKGDRRYRNLIAEGAPPAVIALELGFTHEEALTDVARQQIDAWRSPVDAIEAETDTSEGEPDTETAEVVVALPDPMPAAATTRSARIRQWARGEGIVVAAQGRIPAVVIAAYDDAQLEPDHPVFGEARDGVRDRLTSPAPTVEDLAAANPAFGVAVDPEALPRPEWADVTIPEDIAQARWWAVHLEQELAESERQRAELQASLDRHWTALRAEVETGTELRAELRRTVDAVSAERDVAYRALELVLQRNGAQREQLQTARADAVENENWFAWAIDLYCDTQDDVDRLNRELDELRASTGRSPWWKRVVGR